jgi:hypothetical protein
MDEYEDFAGSMRAGAGRAVGGLRFLEFTGKVAAARFGPLAAGLYSMAQGSIEEGLETGHVSLGARAREAAVDALMAEIGGRVQKAFEARLALPGLGPSLGSRILQGTMRTASAAGAAAFTAPADMVLRSIVTGQTSMPRSLDELADRVAEAAVMGMLVHAVAGEIVGAFERGTPAVPQRVGGAEEQSILGPGPPAAEPEPPVLPRRGPVIVDLQSGTGMGLRELVARTPGATGIGLESGDWLLHEQDVRPTHGPDLDLARQLVRSAPMWPDAPVSQTPFEQIPRLLRSERDPGSAFWPQSGPVRVSPEPFFPARGSGRNLVPRGFGDVASIEATTHPELHGQADQVYLRRPFALAKADAAVTRALGRELNAMLKPGGFVELRLTRQGEFSVPTSGNVLPDQLSAIAAEIPGARIERVGGAAIEAFRTEGRTAGLSDVQREMLENASFDLTGSTAIGEGNIVRIIRIYKGEPPRQSVLLVGPETESEFAWAREVASRGHDVTAVNPNVTPAASTFVQAGGQFVPGQIESLPRATAYGLIREDFPFPLGPMFQPTAAFAAERIDRLLPGGRWVVATESEEFATTLCAVAELQGVVAHSYEIAAAHEGAPQSSHPRESYRVVLVFDKPK